MLNPPNVSGINLAFLMSFYKLSIFKIGKYFNLDRYFRHINLKKISEKAVFSLVFLLLQK
jgi:hypothetical protein